MSEIFEGEVQEVYSGVDIFVLVNLKVEVLFMRVRFRLHGVDTPNAIGAGAVTEAGRLRVYVRNLCRDKKVRLTITSKNANSWVGVLEIQNEAGEYFNLNEDLCAQGYKYKRERS